VCPLNCESHASERIVACDLQAVRGAWRLIKHHQQQCRSANVAESARWHASPSCAGVCAHRGAALITSSRRQRNDHVQGAHAFQCHCFNCGQLWQWHLRDVPARMGPGRDRKQRMGHRRLCAGHPCCATSIRSRLLRRQLKGALRPRSWHLSELREIARKLSQVRSAIIIRGNVGGALSTFSTPNARLDGGGMPVPPGPLGRIRRQEADRACADASVPV
jgi:hypothetical protein